jgi:hypothetical protein
MTTSASGRLGRGFGGLLSIVFLVTMAFLVAAPGTSDAKTQLWLYPDTDDPRAGGHVVTDSMFTLVVENRGRGDDDTATLVSLVVAVNNPDLLGSVTLGWPDDSTSIVENLMFGTPTLPCDGKNVPRHGIYPTFFTTVSIANADAVDEIEPGGSVVIEVEIVGDDGLEVHFDVIAEGHKVKRDTTVCYGVVNPSGHDVTAVLGDSVDAECPVMTINKSASTTGVEVGGEVEYTIEVSGSEDCEPLTNLVITEDIPTVGDPAVPAFTVDNSTIFPAPVSQTDDLITWNLDSLPASDTAVFTLTAVYVEAADGHEVVNTACVTADGIDDPECSSAEVAVGEEPDDDEIGGPGFWCNRIRFAVEGRHNATYTVEELEAFLVEINDDADSGEGSSVFSELYDASTLESAQILLCRPQLAESAADRLARHLLTMWFNIVSDRVDRGLTLDELCPGDEELPEDSDGGMTVGDVVAGAEDELLADEPDDALLDWWKDVIDFINNATIGPDCDEEEPVSQMRRFRGRRLGRH